jgi:homoserine O-acetyltransferase
MASLFPPCSQVLDLPAALPLDGGQSLENVKIAYETYGSLNAEGSNAILICHATTGDQYVASPHPITGKPGWWDKMVGAGKPIDTERFFVICPNVLGSCLGTTGPSSLASDGEPYGLRFPVITIRDMVRAHMALLDVLGVERLYAVIGGSMGGMQALSLSVNWPDRVERVLALATTGAMPCRILPFKRWGGRRLWPILIGRAGPMPLRAVRRMRA